MTHVITRTLLGCAKVVVCVLYLPLIPIVTVVLPIAIVLGILMAIRELLS